VTNVVARGPLSDGDVAAHGGRYRPFIVPCRIMRDLEDPIVWRLCRTGGRRGTFWLTAAAAVARMVEGDAMNEPDAPWRMIEEGRRLPRPCATASKGGNPSARVDDDVFLVMSSSVTEGICLAQTSSR
jgi:hypothetical protein